MGKARTNQISPLSAELVYDVGVTPTDPNEAMPYDEAHDEAHLVKPILENLTNQIDGITNNFSTGGNYESNTIHVWLDGQRLYKPDDYTETGASAFQTTEIPSIGQYLHVRFLPEGSVVSGNPNQVETIVTRSGRGRSVLKLDYSAIVIDTTDSEANFYLPPHHELGDGVFVRVSRMGENLATLIAGDKTSIAGSSQITINTDGGTIELVYVESLQQWLPLQTTVDYVYDIPNFSLSEEEPPQIQADTGATEEEDAPPTNLPTQEMSDELPPSLEADSNASEDVDATSVPLVVVEMYIDPVISDIEET